MWTHAHLLSPGRVVYVCLELVWDGMNWKTAAEQSTSKSPVVTRVWATPAKKRGEFNAHCSLESGWSRTLTLLLFNLTWHLGFCFVLFCFERSKRVKSP